jgi:hypothetical protein
MSNTFVYLGFGVGVIVWLWTAFLAWAYWGLLPALIAFFFPPADLILMFMLGTWPFGLVAVALVAIGGAISSRSES